MNLDDYKNGLTDLQAAHQQRCTGALVTYQQTKAESLSQYQRDRTELESRYRLDKAAAKMLDGWRYTDFDSGGVYLEQLSEEEITVAFRAAEMDQRFKVGPAPDYKLSRMRGAPKL